MYAHREKMAIGFAVRNGQNYYAILPVWCYTGNCRPVRSRAGGTKRRAPAVSGRPEPLTAEPRAWGASRLLTCRGNGRRRTARIIAPRADALPESWPCAGRERVAVQQHTRGRRSGWNADALLHLID